MDFVYQVQVQMADTDATGGIYFTSLLRMANEAFENWLIKQKIDLSEVLLPIAHAEADYKRPLKLWDQMDVRLRCVKVGTSSFTLEADFSDCGSTRIVHVVTDRLGLKQPVSDILKAHLVGTAQSDV